MSLLRTVIFAALFSACNPAQTKIAANYYPDTAISYSNTNLSVDAASVSSGGSIRVTLHLRDTNFNYFVSTLTTVALHAVGGTSTGGIGQITNNGDGTYSASFTGITTGTATSIYATVNGTQIQSAAPTITVTPGNYSLSNSLITVSASSVLITNTVTATLTTYDASNNPLVSGGLPVVFSNSGGTAAGTWSATTDNYNGTYSAVFTSTTAGTATTVHAAIAGNQVTSTLPTITVTGVASSVPTSLAASATPGNVALTWGASTGTAPITYAVKRATVSGGPYTTLQSGISVTNYTDSTVTNGTTYYYVVTSTNVVGTSANSSEVSVRSIGAFTISSVSVNGAGALQVSWGSATGAAAYTLKYGTATGVYGTTVSTSATSPTTVSSLTPGTTYYFMVVATNAVGSGTSANATTESSGIPMAAFTMTAASRATTSSSVTWAASAGATSYTLKYGTATGVYGTTVSTSATSPQAVSGLSTGTTYYYRVTAVNSSGSLDSTAELSQTTLTALAHQWPFDAAPDPTQTYSFDGTKIDFTGGVCRLTGNDQLDDSNATSGFGDGTAGGGTYIGVAPYGALTGEPSSSGLKLGSHGGCNGTTNACANQSAPELYEYNSEWTPQWGSLSHYWKMNNDWTDSRGTAHGAAVGTPGFTSSSKVGTAAGNLDGTTGAITVSGVTATSSVTKFTIAFWMKPTTLNTLKALAATINPSVNAIGFAIETGTTASRLLFDVSNAGSDAYGETPVGTLATGSWYHVVMVYDGTQTGNAARLVAYVNGNPMTLTFTGTVPATSQTSAFDLQIGQLFDNSRRFNGALDDMAIWTTALTAAEVQQIYQRQTVNYSGVFTSRVMEGYQSQSWTSLEWLPTLPFFKALPDYAGGAIQNETSADYSSLVGSTQSPGANDLMTGIKGLWHLDEAAGTTGANVIDYSSGSGSNCTPSGSVTFGSNGKLRTGVNFGTGYIDCGDDTNLNFGTGSFTISAWIQPVNSNQYASFLSKRQAVGPFTQWNFLIYGSWNGGVPTTGKNLALIYYEGANSRVIKTSSAVADGNWHHAVAVGDSTAGTITLYVDGSPAASTTELSGGAWPNITNTAPFQMGGNNTGSGTWTGNSLDEVAIWNRALGATEVKQLYQRGASRLKFQVKSCTASDCSDNTAWKGPSGSAHTYFSELFNMSTQAATPSGTVNRTLPSMTLQNYTSPVATNRYFQYRVIFESDSATTSLMPELKSVTVGPTHYDTSAPTIINKTGVSYHSLTNYVQTLGSGGCASGVLYNLGTGASYSTATWYYWNGSAWTAVTVPGVGQANSSATIATNASTFGSQVGTGTIYFKAFLQSSGSSKCELDNLELDLLY